MAVAKTYLWPVITVTTVLLFFLFFILLNVKIVRRERKTIYPFVPFAGYEYIFVATYSRYVGWKVGNSTKNNVRVY